ncbi:MAG: hypothetical protein ACJAZ2_002132 [Glaciecola sp.]|jgi:hypothetical protein
MEINKEYIFLGSGPICLIKAMLLLKSESTTKITFIDSASQGGGAWYSDVSPEGSEIETGCHIWSYCPITYQFIEEEIGVPLFDMTPAPVFNRGRINISYGLKGTLDSYKFILTNLLKLKFDVLKNIRNLPNIHFRLFGKRNKYPKNGSPEFIEKLLKKLEKDKRVSFVFDTDAKVIDIGSNTTVKCSDKLIECDKVFLTSTSALEELNFYDKKIEVAKEIRSVNYIHYLVQLSFPAVRKTSYIRLTSDEIIHRITDVSYQSNSGENLILIGVKEAATGLYSQDEIMAHVQSNLLSQKIINENSKVTFAKDYCFPTHYSNEKVRAAINELENNKIELLHSTDLMYGIQALLQDS